MNDQTQSFGPSGEPSPSDVRREAERAGQRKGAQVGKFAEKAGVRFDSTEIDQMEEKAQSVKQSFQSLTDEGWEGMKKKAVDYTRKEPMNALLLAIGTGILVGLATRRAR